MTAPVPASTNTWVELGAFAVRPVSTVSQASRERLSVARTTSRWLSTLSTVRSCLREVDSAAFAETVAVVGTLMRRETADCEPRTRPLESATTTASPPITGRPR